MKTAKWLEEKIKAYLPQIHQKGLEDLFKQAKQMDDELAAKFSKEGMKEDLRKVYYNAFIQGYGVGQKDAQSHPLAITIADHIHTDFEKWFENCNWK
jgi:hypothetical protein